MTAQLQIQPTTRPVLRVVPKHDAYEEQALEVRILSGLDLIIVKGWSIAPDVQNTYENIMSFITTHLSTKNELTIYFKYELFNPITVRYLFKIIMLLNRKHASGKIVRVYWNAGEMMEDMADTGYDLAQLCDFDFKISQL
jgi:hypothetical protein